MNTCTLNKERDSVKFQALATMFAVILAVAAPQFFHWMGVATGTGTALSVIFLPMHFSIIFAGFFVGPIAGACAGICAPIISFLLTGMPIAVKVPLMMVELGLYGFSAGILSKIKMPLFFKILLVQFIGRIGRILFTLLLVMVSGAAFSDLTTIGNGLLLEIPGVCLQWLLFSFIFYLIKLYRAHRKEI